MLLVIVSDPGWASTAPLISQGQHKLMIVYKLAMNK